MEDDKSNKKKSKYIGDMASFASQGIQVASTGLGVAGDIAPVLVPFTNFLPLIKEIGSVFEAIIDIVEAAEHNKRTCKVLKERVRVAKLAVQQLREEKDEKEDFFNKNNYSSLQELAGIIKQIEKFVLEISQMKTLTKYIKAKNTEKKFTELCNDFDSCVKLLSFSIDVKITGQVKSISNELEQFKIDQDDLAKYLQDMVAGVSTDVKGIGKDVKGIGDGVKDIGNDTKEIKDSLKDLNDQFSSTVVKVNTMSTTMEKLLMAESSQNQKKIDNIFQVNPLKISDYEQDDIEDLRKNGRVSKWYNIKNKSEEFAFKTISEQEDQKLVQNQVTILKELHDCQNIIKFYGLTCEGNKWYLVTEWAEYGNLREYYTNNKDQFDLRLKLRMSLDIARGLNFLRAVEVIL
ncbi:hypothetical protein GLOIN_2v65477 [Rhizophagus irregularis DAOM 181602=DAOM 197198]|uniref:Protein kinase domain-containing protein n=1 Tax=Rhizophagus irregularis (strain DAOM 181602 / DAOM 197198 / MUCL 43194) TaxID=747089 RepID=A0A2P4Q149_RHIID|nr:hypothetical protein GLOIN_2v65477 [Rhizophagus irregularis DAOM 181602=DAOM 197198]POG71359.1 hypothetical protein GLOIN_2v65477 [Rhizophagus irregularis DAOM 181602=DAOM 197198]|eukprot:XP_025178225.1 hypothetical protein GLOIN_2v65477 [Rhizophagus irregularis DAOM 181602=DAOM 197198]